MSEHRNATLSGWARVCCTEVTCSRLPIPTRAQDPNNPGVIITYDPATGGVLGTGTARVYTDAEVRATVAAARVAQAEWVKTSFAERGEVLKLINDYIVENQDLICRVACRDTGKTSKSPPPPPFFFFSRHLLHIDL